MKKLTTGFIGLAVLGALEPTQLIAKEKQLLWGDTHLHTYYSVDAYLMENRSVSPDEAYRFAKGLPTVHPYHKARIQLKEPLDFLAVSDHGEYLGVVKKAFEGDPLLMKTETGKRWKELNDQGKSRQAYFEVVKVANTGQGDPAFVEPELRKTIWTEVVAAADRHNEPGKFTALVGWEWSSLTNGANLHRVVLTDASSKQAENFLPYTLLDSDRPEDLWNWLEKTSDEIGANFIAIPHNANISKGKMFSDVDSDGNAIDRQYAEQRAMWEPVIEVTQIKGDSETHPSLSPTDEFAGYEKYESAMVGVGFKEKKTEQLDQKANYARSALKRGLTIKQDTGVNPYQFGMIGSSDSHTGYSTVEEDNFGGKMPIDSTPENVLNPKKLIIPPKSYGMDMGAAGLAAVWAEQNTREDIIAAFKRKEVYATTGTRIKLRVYAGFEYTDMDARSNDISKVGNAKGVPMGSSVTKADGKALSLLIEAVKDPRSANLDRIQVVKGWVDSDGKEQEKVFNVAWAGNRALDDAGKLPAITNTVDLATATYSNDVGSKRLVTTWQDPEFSAEQDAFYYVRVLEIPTPRHTLYDAVALNRKHPKGYDATIQERAYSSPIWYIK